MKRNTPALEKQLKNKHTKVCLPMIKDTVIYSILQYINELLSI